MDTADAAVANGPESAFADGPKSRQPNHNTAAIAAHPKGFAMANIRMLPPASGNSNTIVISGRSYTCAANSFLDMLDTDARIAQANGWVDVAGAVGATAARPTGSINRGFKFYDTTLAFLVVWDGLAWRRPDTGAVA